MLAITYYDTVPEKSIKIFSKNFKIPIDSTLIKCYYKGTTKRETKPNATGRRACQTSRWNLDKCETGTHQKKGSGLNLTSPHNK